MGTYLNPGNSGFIGIRNDIYVDKSGLIDLINQTINTPRCLTCISRPRRFGKSYAAKMLCAYYDKTCDSSALFDNLEISQKEEMNNSYRQHLNKYDVIYLDMTYVKLFSANFQNIVPYLSQKITEELLMTYPTLQVSNELPATMIHATELTGNKFVMIIDEWDAPIREAPAVQKEYLEFLRTLFKGSGTTDKIFAAVYMTGILPIKKDGTESAISDFWEYTMLDPGCFQSYVGFTEDEVKHLCEQYDICFADAKRWYDGYSFDSVSSIYNPYSIIKAVNMKKFKSYWRMSSAADSLEAYISCDYDGLFTSVTELLGGLSIPVDTNGFNNDISTVRNRDDILTLLIHLGYLTYDESEETVSIPNEEIRMEFTKSGREIRSADAIQRLQESRHLIQDTVQMNADAVAAQIEKIHAEITDPLHYNNEQSLRSVIHIAYYSYPEYYLKFEELPSGNGYADIVYLPKRTSQLPALVIELKWNQSAKGAIAQIKDRQYYNALKDYGGDILLVGISYDKNARNASRKHSCIIEKFRPES
ncbi:MAG: ATP-binding protein [Lachnospiraceae bacterium]|nr:ATP-binding protein [Lachnospiraceae bacterium]